MSPDKKAKPKGVSKELPCKFGLHAVNRDNWYIWKTRYAKTGQFIYPFR